MNLNFITDPEMAPQPREEIEILEFDLSPYPDRRRVKMSIRLTPFAPVDRPNLQIWVVNAANEPAGEISVIGAMQTRLNLTMHLRDELIDGEYTFTANLSFDDEPPQHQVTQQIDLSSSSLEPTEEIDSAE